MLRTRQYIKLYRKYHSWDLFQRLETWNTAKRAYNKLVELEWRKQYEKDLSKMW